MLMLILASTALAKCPWGKAPEVEATATAVIVNGKTWSVAGENWKDFQEVLEGCGDDLAAEKLELWRRHYQWMWVPPWTTAITAPGYRRQMVEAIKEGK